MSDGLQAELLEGLPYPPTHFDLYSLDQLQEDDRESDRYLHITVHRLRTLIHTQDALF